MFEWAYGCRATKTKTGLDAGREKNKQKAEKAKKKKEKAADRWPLAIGGRPCFGCRIADIFCAVRGGQWRAEGHRRSGPMEVTSAPRDLKLLKL